MLNNILRSANDIAIATTDLDFRITYYNPMAEKLLGYSAEQVIGKTVQEMHTKEKVTPERFVDAIEQVRSKGEYRYFLEQKTDNEYIRHLESRVTGIISPNGDIIGYSLFSRDITERKQVELKIQASLLEKETLLKEIHHRVKNNLQVISSLLDLQSSHVQDEKAKAALRESMERVRTMATIHTQLYQSQDLTKVDIGLFMRDLISNISQSYGRVASAVKINVDNDETMLGIDASIPCGLILNELVTNALKHAFPGGKEGKINITMRSEDNQAVLTISDNGIGFPKPIDFNNLKSLGLQLVNILVRQINGKIDLQVDGGTTWTIIFPINNERERQNG
jgi:PAS domain S-box-containing protein